MRSHLNHNTNISLKYLWDDYYEEMEKLNSNNHNTITYYDDKWPL